MLNDAINALTQMVSPPLRAILWKTIALALALVIVVAIALERLIAYLVGAGSASVETTFGPQAHAPVDAIAWRGSLRSSHRRARPHSRLAAHPRGRPRHGRRSDFGR